MKPWIFSLIFIFSKVTNIYGLFSIEPISSASPGDKIVLTCQKSDELHDAVFWKDNSVKLSTCLKEGDCHPPRSTLRPHITFTVLPAERIFYMIIDNATLSDFQTYICGDSDNETTAEIKKVDKSDCCGDCTRSSSDIPLCPKRIEEECSQAVSMMGLLVFSIGMNVILLCICIVFMVKRRMNQQTRKHNDQWKRKVKGDAENEGTTFEMKQ